MERKPFGWTQADPGFNRAAAALNDGCAPNLPLIVPQSRAVTSRIHFWDSVRPWLVETEEKR
jgi:hypothetical protein